MPMSRWTRGEIRIHSLLFTLRAQSVLPEADFGLVDVLDGRVTHF